MVPLGTVLELIHSSAQRFRAARLVGWRGRGTWRLWWAGDDRYRHERDGESGMWVSVRNGDVWWVLQPDGQAETNEGESRVVLGMPPEFALLHPRSLLAAAVLEVLRDEMVAGRTAVIVRATPRRGQEAWRWWGLGDASQPVEIPIDLERGIALGGLGMRVEEVAFDEDFPPRLFARPYGHDHEWVESALVRPRAVSLDEARRLVTFPLRLPGWLPDGARLVRCVLDAHEPPRWVGLSWAVDPGHLFSLHLRQGPAVDRDAARSPWSQTVVEGLHVSSPDEETEDVVRHLFVRTDGGWCEIDSDLPLPTILTVARSLTAVP